MKKIVYILLAILVIVIIYISNIKADVVFFKTDKNSAYKDEIVNITVDLNNIIYDKFNIVITSNESVNSLQTNDINITNIENNEISIDIDKLSMDINTINFTYQVNNSLNEGDNIIFSAKVTEISDSEENTDSIVEYVLIKVEKKKEDIEGDNQNSNQKPNNNQNFNNKTRTSNYSRSSIKTSSFNRNVETITYNGSDNNYLNSLSIKGYSLNKKFSKERSTYFATVKNSTKKVTINYKKSSSKSNVIVTGNTNLKVGINKVLVTVNAENGNSRVYRIYITREGNS